MWSDAVYRLVEVRFEVWPADHSRLMWRPSVIDWWNNAWYWRDCVQHSSLFHSASARNSWDGQFWRQLRSIDIFQHVNVKLNAIFYSVCCGESDIVLVVGAPHLRIYSVNRRWIQLLNEHSKTSSPMRAAVAWDNYLPSAEHSRSGTPLRLIYRACEEVRGRVATGYDDTVLWGGREAVLRTATIPSLPESFPSKSIRIAAGTWKSCTRQLTVGVLKFFLS